MTASGTALRSDRIAGATRWRLAFLAIQGGSSVVLFSALSHLLPARALAATALAQGVIVIAQAIGDFGLSQAAVTVLPARIAEARGGATALLSGAATAYLGATCLAGLLTLAAVPFVPASAAAPVAVSALAAAAAVVVAGADGILRSQGDFRRPVLLMAASELAGFAGLPAAALTGSAFWTCAAIAVGMAAGASGAVLALLQIQRRARPASLRSFVSASVPLGVSQILIAAATRADTLLAGSISGLIAAGTFEGCWRVYQLSQYLAGGVASAAAPFIADRLGAGRPQDAAALLGRLVLRIASAGVVLAAGLYLLRSPIADLLTGSLGMHVSRSLPALVLVSPLGAIGFIGYYAVIGQDGQRRYVLVTFAAGAAVNLVLATVLGRAHGASGIVVACAAGQAVTNLLLIVRLGLFLRSLRQAPTPGATSCTPTGISRPVP